MADESESSCVSWSAQTSGQGRKQQVSSRIATSQAGRPQRTVHHALLHLQHLVVGPLHLFLVFFHLCEVSSVVMNGDRDVRRRFCRLCGESACIL